VVLRCISDCDLKDQRKGKEALEIIKPVQVLTAVGSEEFLGVLCLAKFAST